MRDAVDVLIAAAAPFTAALCRQIHREFNQSILCINGRNASPVNTNYLFHKCKPEAVAFTLV